jgi:hypothetical protein
LLSGAARCSGRRDIRQAHKALGHARIETTARHYIVDELEVGVTDGLY